MRLEHRWLGPVCLAALLTSCGSEGGVVGSGISSTISGNVVEVREGPQPLADVPRLIVRLEEFDGVEDSTADDGSFQLSGEFAGPVVVRFENLSGRFLARLPLDVPAGATVEVEDIEIDPALPNGARPREVRQRNFVGRVFEVNCALSGFVLDDDRSRPFRVRILPDTVIRLRPGDRAGTCADIRRGDFARVEGVVVPEGAGVVLNARLVVVGPNRPPPR